MSVKTTIFMIGVTGYIGGAVLEAFLNRPDASANHIVAIVRSLEKAKKLRDDFGVEAVVGSFSDLPLIEKLASEANVTIAMADCDDMPSAQAILKGIKKRFEASGKPSILIHTSGTGVLSVDSRGLEKTEEVYDDMNPDQIETLPDTQIHRNVELEILKADKEGYVKTYIISPSTIYGISKGKLVDAGISNPHSQQIPGLIKIGLARGQGGMVGQGKNLWPNVEIHELAQLYSILYDVVRTKPDVGHGREGIYFGANGEHKLYDVSKAVAQALFDVGKGKSPEPTTLTEEDFRQFPGATYLGSNSRCVANRSYSIGWAPKKTTVDLLASIKPEVDALVAKT